MKINKWLQNFSRLEPDPAPELNENFLNASFGFPAILTTKFTSPDR